jgi:hypothetical protein
MVEGAPDVFPSAQTRSEAIYFKEMRVEERLSMSSPKNAAIKFGKESYEGRKTRETFTRA